MKKIFVFLATATALMLSSCVKEPVSTEAKAVLGEETLIDFAAQSPAAKVITVISDADWHVTAPAWLTVEPSTGSGTTEVTVTAAPNVDAEGALEPRQDTLMFSGKTLASRYIIIVRQAGDAYRAANKLTVSEFAALEDGVAAVIPDATVAAASSAGYVITDGTAFMYVKTTESANAGDKLSIKGYKGSVNGVPVVSQVDEFKVLSSGTFTPGTPEDITAGIGAADLSKTAFVSINGVEASGVVQVEDGGATYAVRLVDPVSECSIASMTAHKVKLVGYTYGKPGANLVALIPVEVVDNGPAVVPRPDKLLKAKWRFTTSYYPAYADKFGGTAGIVDQTEGFSDLYVPSLVEGDGKITYYQVDKTGYTPTSGNPKRIVGGTGHPYVTGAWPGDYWLFSATDNYEYPAGTNLHIKFLTRISGTGQKFWMLEYWDGAAWKPAEEYPVQVETETGTNAEYNFIEPTSNVAVECNWTLAAPCREPMFRMRCVANWQSNGSGALANPNGGTCRIADNDDNGEDAGPVFEVTDAPEGPVTPVVPDVPKPSTPLHAEWLFNATAAQAAAEGNAYPYYTTFGNIFNGTAVNQAEGEAGYVNANVAGTGKISWNHPADMSSIDTGGSVKLGVGSTGHPYVTGVWPGDFWYFEATDGYTYPIGTTVHIKFVTRISGTGQKYWLQEYWDGAAWQPVAPVQTVDVAGTTITYNFTPTTESSNTQVDFTWQLAAGCSVMKFRYTCAGNCSSTSGAPLEAPNGGTCRIAGAVDTSPIFEVIE